MNMLRALAVVVGLAPAQLLAQPGNVGTFDLPSGTEVGKALATLCAAEAQGVTLGFAARESGYSLEYVLAKMQEPTDAALKSIYRGLKLTVEDVYAHPLIGYHTMFYYRSKVCFRERTELKTMPSIVFSAAKLLRCEQEFGREGSPELLSCVEQAVGAL
jgi:hypothetical protein